MKLFETKCFLRMCLFLCGVFFKIGYLQRITWLSVEFFSKIKMFVLQDVDATENVNHLFFEFGFLRSL